MSMNDDHIIGYVRSSAVP